MKIYLAGGMPLMNVKGRERAVASKMSNWHRLFSYHYKLLIFKSEILTIVKENENISCNMDAGGVTGEIVDKKTMP